MMPLAFSFSPAAISSGKVFGGCEAGIGEDLGVVEQPVLAVDVDRHGVELAVADGRLDDRLAA